MMPYDEKSRRTPQAARRVAPFLELFWLSQAKHLFSDFYIENATFLILDNITLAYTFRQLNWMDARLYATVQNLFTLSPYSGPNPEIGNGIDNNLYPRATNFIFGVNLTF